MAHQLPRQVERELKSLVSELRNAGFTPTASQYSPEAFGNWYVDFTGSIGRLCIVKDRSQYTIDGPGMDVLQRAGLWRAFDSFDEFSVALLSWLRSQASDP